MEQPELEFPQEQTSGIYPNPAADHVMISASKSIIFIIITDINGKEVLKQGVNKNQTFNLTALSAGIYRLKLMFGSDSEVHKLVIQ